MSSATRKAFVVGASIAAFVACRDQGLYRWNHALMSLQKHAKANLVPYYYQARNSLSRPPSTSLILSKDRRQEKMQRREESLKKVMYLSSWGPSTVRF